MKHKHFNRLLSMLLVVATLFGLMAVPASAASLGDSGTVTIQQAGYGNYLSKKNGGTIGGGYWKYTSRQHNTNLNSNGSEYYGTFKVCLPVDNVPTEGSFTIKATGGVAQYNLFLAYNPAASEQSYIISDPGYTTLEAQIPFKWSGTEETDTASLQVIKAGAGGAPLEGAEFTLTGSGGTTVTGTTDRSGQIVWRDLPADEKFTLTETAAPAGYVLDKTPHGIHIDPYDPATEDDPVLTVTNWARPPLRILKYDLKSNSPMPDVTFEVWHDGDLFGEYTTNASGEIFLYDLDPGTYLVKEVATDDAHVVNSTPQQIELKAGETQTRELVFFNSLKPGIHLVKVDSVTMKSLPNVRFEFKLVGGSYRQEFTTDINGEIDLSKLTPGAYEVRELEAPDGYLIDDAVRVVQVNPDENANFVFTNTPKPSLRLIKTSSDGTRLGGVHFRIARIEDGTHYLDRITDDNGGATRS
ncbi:MSCRAMM family protein [Acutalibacter intestini]|uniref:MSCRAMM family protein n=1 Tax=Acutalibacter intestini TaxID=3093659 RepID=UPI002AC8FC60|nr:SpaA isopeptide-forming pilin-related protein [Acutalibacter sp. M00204]